MYLKIFFMIKNVLTENAVHNTYIAAYMSVSDFVKLIVLYFECYDTK